MTKLFNKFLTASATALAVFCSFACSDKIAGTAEEPNQCAFGDESSSSSDRILIPDTSNGISSGTENSQKPISSSSYINSLPGFEISSSSAPEHHDIIPTPAQSSSEMASDGGGKAGFPEFGNPDCYCIYRTESISCQCGTSKDTASTLDEYFNKYGITEVTYDDNVVAYNVTLTYCDSTKKTCSERPSTAKLREIGLHKITNDNVRDLPYLFEKTIWAMHGNLYGRTDGSISRTPDGCPLYVLNINDTSPVVHVLTKISKDTIAITDVHDNCDYERRPFDMHVGFLFEYCDELSESPKIEQTFLLKETWNCSDIDYDEYINKKLK